MHSASAGRHTTARRTYSSAVDTLDTVLPTAVRPPLVCTWTCSTLTVGIAGRNADTIVDEDSVVPVSPQRVAMFAVLPPQLRCPTVGFPGGFRGRFIFGTPGQGNCASITFDRLSRCKPSNPSDKCRTPRYRAGSNLQPEISRYLSEVPRSRACAVRHASDVFGHVNLGPNLVRRRQPRPEKLLCWGTALLPTTPDGVATAHVVALLLGEGERHAQGAVGGGARGRIVCRCPLLSNLPHVQRVDLRRRLLLPR